MKLGTFKYRKGNTGNNYRAKSSSGRVCSKCNTSHPPRECPAFGKKCHKCGHKNHFSTCCRSKQKSQGDSNNKRPSWGRSTERHHRPKGRCSKSRSRSRSNTPSAHSIELNNDQENTVTKMFNTIYRSKSVSSIRNETDPDGRTKIITLLKIKLPHRDVIDNLQVKVDDGAEANILPLDSFRSMFPHALNKEGYPVEGFLKGSRTNLECYDGGRLINHGSIELWLQHYSNKSFQDHTFYVVETKTHKEIIVGHLASIRLGLIQVLCKNIVQAYCSHRNQLQEFLSRSSLEHWWQGTMWRAEKQIRVLQRPLIMFFKETSWEHIWSWCQNPSKWHRYESSFKSIQWYNSKVDSFQDPKTFSNIDFFQDPYWRVKRLNSRYMVPVNEVSLVISDPQTVKTAQPVKEQPSRGPPPKGSRFNPIYIEPGSTSIESTRDL